MSGLHVRPPPGPPFSDLLGTKFAEKPFPKGTNKKAPQKTGKSAKMCPNGCPKGAGMHPKFTKNHHPGRLGVAGPPFAVPGCSGRGGDPQNHKKSMKKVCQILSPRRLRYAVQKKNRESPVLFFYTFLNRIRRQSTKKHVFNISERRNADRNSQGTVAARRCAPLDIYV